MSRRSVYDWRRAVFRSEISPNVRLLLIYMSDHMQERNRHVSIPRVKMAAALGWAEQRVSQRLKEAVEAGFLSSVEPGYRGHTAVYQGLFPDVLEAERVRENRSQSQPRKHGRYVRGMRPQNTDTNTRADPLSRGDHREKRSNDEGVPTPVGAEVTATWWEREPPAEDGYSETDQRESA